MTAPIIEEIELVGLVACSTNLVNRFTVDSGCCGLTVCSIFSVFFNGFTSGVIVSVLGKDCLFFVSFS